MVLQICPKYGCLCPKHYVGSRLWSLVELRNAGNECIIGEFAEGMTLAGDWTMSLGGDNLGSHCMSLRAGSVEAHRCVAYI